MLTGRDLAAHFDAKYAECPDPWGHEWRWYERRKRRLLLASLTRPRYRRAVEVGCGNGVLAAALAARCGSLVAVDVSPAAVRLARARLAGRAGVSVQRRFVPAEWPTGRFDLVVLSETGFYLTAAELDQLVDAAAGSLDRAGEFAAVHWRHPVDDGPLDGNLVHQRLRRDRRFESRVAHREADFRIDVLVRR